MSFMISSQEDFSFLQTAFYSSESFDLVRSRYQI